MHTPAKHPENRDDFQDLTRSLAMNDSRIPLVDISERPQGRCGELLGTASPRSVVERGALIADELIAVVREKKLYTKVGGRPYMLVDGWLFLAGMLGLVLRVVGMNESDVEFVAEVELVRALDGAVMGRGFGSCGLDEPTWKKRPRYARRAMAQTRAIARACRSLSWIPRLAGLSSVAAEESRRMKMATTMATRWTRSLRITPKLPWSLWSPSPPWRP